MCWHVMRIERSSGNYHTTQSIHKSKTSDRVNICLQLTTALEFHDAVRKTQNSFDDDVLVNFSKTEQGFKNCCVYIKCPSTPGQSQGHLWEAKLRGFSEEWSYYWKIWLFLFINCLVKEISENDRTRKVGSNCPRWHLFFLDQQSTLQRYTFDSHTKQGKAENPHILQSVACI